MGCFPSNDKCIFNFFKENMSNTTVFDTVQFPSEFGRISVFEKFYVKKYNIELTVS